MTDRISSSHPSHCNPTTSLPILRNCVLAYHQIKGLATVRGWTFSLKKRIQLATTMMTETAIEDTDISASEESCGFCGTCEKSWWRPTSAKHLEKAEEKILSALDIPYSGQYVKVNEDQIWTVKVNPTNSNRTPLVLMHGFGAGLAFWVMNFKAISQNRPVYAIDTLGFARSTRRNLPYSAEEAEEAFVACIDGWREANGIDKMILLGHSFGGYLAYAYGLRHPERLKHLVLADPWGFPEHGPEERQQLRERLPFWARGIALVVFAFNPLSGIRAAGPLGPHVVKRIRGDIGNKFQHMFDDDRIMNYIYHCNAQQPASGETAFKSMSAFGAWAQRPMVERAHLLNQDVPLDVIYGTKTWMDLTIGERLYQIRRGSHVRVHHIRGAGHHVYADRADEFNNTVNKICKNIE